METVQTEYTKRLLNILHMMINQIDIDAAKVDDPRRAIFLEGKSAGLNVAYRIIKSHFEIV